MTSIWNGTSSLVCVAAMLVGCGGSTSPEGSSDLGSTISEPGSAPDGGARDADTIDVSQPIAAGAAFVFLSKGADGRYAIDEINTSSRTESVTRIDFGAAERDASTLEAALLVPRTVAALGTIQNDTFVATAVYRALPGLTPAGGDSFYQATFRRGGDTATALNLGQETEIAQVDLSNVNVPFIDRTWLAARILEAGAIAAGTLDSTEASLAVTTVYLPVPDEVTCAAPVDTCGSGTAPMYAREPSRCLSLIGCSRPGMCPMYMPLCDTGYELSSWPSRMSGCPAFACDPMFDPPPAD
jgi:hypothetical protein